MKSGASLVIGLVPSLEALPLMELAKQHEDWKIVPCPSYGRIIRQLLSSQISAGLLPFDVFLSEILNYPAVIERWCVPIVMPPATTELVVSPRIMKQINTEASSKAQAKQLVIGIESRSSLTRHQFVSWQKSQRSLAPLKVVFRMLPMELMHSALQAETLDGFVAPTPWGMAAEAMGDCHLAPGFSPAKLAQELVLCCDRTTARLGSSAWRALPGTLEHQRKTLLAESSDRIPGTADAPLHSILGCEPGTWRRCLDQWRNDSLMAEFCPKPKWLSHQIQRLAKLLPQISNSDLLTTLPDNLALATIDLDMHGF